jgi:predicted ATP-dependent endonuclease of OLD family
MIIKSISIQNFKCHKKIQDLPLHDLTTLIGENDSGKTTIIDFLEIMLTNKTPSQTDFYRSMRINQDSGELEEFSQKEIIGELIFALDDNEKTQLQEYIDDKQNICLKRVFTDTSTNTYIRCKKFDDNRFYQYESMSAPDLKQFLVDLNLEEQPNQDLRKTAVLHYIENTKIPFHFDWREISFPQIKAYFPKFIRYKTEDYKDPTSMVFKVLQEVYENQLYRQTEGGKRELIDENLKSIVKTISTNLKLASGQFLGHVQKYNEKIQEISIEPGIDLSRGLLTTPILIKDETGIFYNLDSRGYGTKKRIFLAIFEWNKEVLSHIHQEYAVRCYDEPDDSLHIEAQRSLYKAIKSITATSLKKNQIIICTHSLFMIDSAPADSINLLKREENGDTSIEFLKTFGDYDIQKFIEVMCREMGLSNSHIFFEKCFVLLEGPTEMNFLPLVYRKIYDSSLAEDGITLINLEGNGSAINFLKLLMKNKKDLTILFLDKDSSEMKKGKLKNAFNKTFEGMPQAEYDKFIDIFFDECILFAGTKEFEDSFSSASIVKVLGKNRIKNNTKPWSEKEIEDLRNEKRKFSDDILKIVSDNCSPNYLSKPELGLYLGQELEVAEIPQIVKDLFIKCRAIAGIEK